MRAESQHISRIVANVHVGARPAMSLGACETGPVLAPGTTAPDFSLPDQHGHVVSLAAMRGSWVLLWWYPKAATPG